MCLEGGDDEEEGGPRLVTMAGEGGEEGLLLGLPGGTPLALYIAPRPKLFPGRVVGGRGREVGGKRGRREGGRGERLDSKVSEEGLLGARTRLSRAVGEWKGGRMHFVPLWALLFRQGGGKACLGHDHDLLLVRQRLHSLLEARLRAPLPSPHHHRLHHPACLILLFLLHLHFLLRLLVRRLPIRDLHPLLLLLLLLLLPAVGGGSLSFQPRCLRGILTDRTGGL